MITAMVFLAEDTNGMVIHLNGFDDKRHADNFVKKLMKKSGIEYNSILDLTELPTLTLGENMDKIIKYWNSRSTNIKAVVVAAIVIVVISIIF